MVEPRPRGQPRPLETRYPCPVCLGATLEKTRVDAAGTLVLDHCRRCGGVWFEEGEVVRLRATDPVSLWSRIAPAEELVSPRCHDCLAHVDRRVGTCPACGREQRLACPHCRESLRPVAHEGLRVDACEACRGIWFDHHELWAIWRTEVGGALERRGVGVAGPAAGRGGDVAGGVGEAVLYAPDLVLYTVLQAREAAAHGAAAGLPAAAEATGAVVEAAGEAAAGVFEVIVEVLAGLFG